MEFFGGGHSEQHGYQWRVVYDHDNQHFNIQHRRPASEVKRYQTWTGHINADTLDEAINWLHTRMWGPLPREVVWPK